MTVVTLDFSQQTDLFDPRRFSWSVHVIGAGGIGSALLYALAKLGVQEIHVWDDDLVETRNLASQLLYRPSDVGKPKVEAVYDFMVRQEVDSTITIHQERVTPETPLEGVVIGCVDSMASRAAIWEAIKYNPQVVLYLDGRIGGELTHLLSCNPSVPTDIEHYEAWLFNDDEAAELPCAARSVIHPAVGLASLTLSQLAKFSREEETAVVVIAHFGAPHVNVLTED